MIIKLPELEGSRTFLTTLLPEDHFHSSAAFLFLSSFIKSVENA